MKYYTKAFTLIVCLLTFLFCQPQDTAQKGDVQEETTRHRYLVTATVNNCEGCQVIMRTEIHRNLEKVDSAVVKDGKFYLSGFIAESGFYGITVRYPKLFATAKIYLPADSVHLIMDAAGPLRPDYFPRSYGAAKNYSVMSNSPFQAEVDAYLWKRDSLWQKYFDDESLVRERYRQTFDSGDPVLVQQWADSLENFGNRFPNYFSYAADLFILEGASPETSLFAMMECRDDRMATERFTAYLDALPAEHRQSPQGQYLANYLTENEQRNKNNQRFVNSRIRDLDLKGSTPTGEEVDESEIFKANKLTLVEFWASWCGPCRIVMPEYYELYEKYRGKGMGFIAVSLDNRRELWLRAVEQDGLDIHHVSELKGTGGEDMKRFEIKGIPANMLIDNTGKIVAVDISRMELRDKLKESL